MKSNKLENFPRVFYLSLEESVDRQKLLEKQFSEYGIVDIVPIISKRFSECDDKVKGELLHVLDAGTTGCVLSHLKAIQKWYDEYDDDYAFFCEDDLSVESVKYWNFTWEDFIRNLPEDAECVQLTSVKRSFDTIQLRERCDFDWSTAAYIITRDYARKILQRHVFGDEYDLTLTPNPEYQPLSENIIFYGLGKTYTIDLFVENLNVNTTFKEIEGGYKPHHIESYEFIINWWKDNGLKTTIGNLLGLVEEKLDRTLEELLTKYSLDTENAESNFNVGLYYENVGHTAPALSYFLRCAERSDDENLSYEALIHAANCYDRQGTRDLTSKGILQQALCLNTKRPEAYFLLAKFYDKRENWQECYIYASQGLEYADLTLPPLKTDVEYPGAYGLWYEKGVSAWWWGKSTESERIFKKLSCDSNVNEHYSNLISEKINKFFPNLLTPESFDWGPTNPEYAQMFAQENFVERTYEKHCPVKSGDVVLDIGANCGSFTYSILSKNPKHVYCIEPSNTLIDFLKKNVGHGPVTFINKGIAATENTSQSIPDKGVYVYENQGNTYATTTFKKFIEENKINKIDFLKFDCEGGEYSIFTEENYPFIRNHVKHFAGEWHINDHENAVERFIKFRDLYFKDCLEYRVYERCGKEVTQDIFNDDYLIAFREWWKSTNLGQFILYVTYDISEDPEETEEVFDVSCPEKMDIVLQGQYEDYTDEIIDNYLKLPFVDKIIVSCWENDKPNSYSNERVKFVRSKYPLTPGTCNKNLQIVTSFAGIKECKTKFSAKMRSDQNYHFDSMIKMYEFMLENHVEHKIFVAGMFPALLFHPRDHIYWGKTEDLKYLFDIPLEYNSLIDKVRIGKYELTQYANYLIRPETYIGAHYCTRFDDRIKLMLIEPEKYLYDGCPNWNESYTISAEILPKAFKSFPSKEIDFVWPKRNTYSYPYEEQWRECHERWHEDGY